MTYSFLGRGGTCSGWAQPEDWHVEARYGVSIVTAAPARARPDRVAPDVRVMLATARIFSVKECRCRSSPSCRPLPV